MHRKKDGFAFRAGYEDIRHTENLLSVNPEDVDDEDYGVEFRVKLGAKSTEVLQKIRYRVSETATGNNRACSLAKEFASHRAN